MADTPSKRQQQVLRTIIIVLDIVGIILSCITTHILFLLVGFIFLLSLLFNVAVLRYRHKGRIVLGGPDNSFSRPRGYVRFVGTDGNQDQADRAAIAPENDHEEDVNTLQDTTLPRWAKNSITCVDILFVPGFVTLHVVSGVAGVRGWPGMFAVEAGMVCMSVGAIHGLLAFLALKSTSLFASFSSFDVTERGFMPWRTDVPVSETSARSTNDAGPVVEHYYCPSCKRKYTATMGGCTC